MALSRGSKLFLVILVVVFGVVGGGLAYVAYLMGGDRGVGEPVEIQVTPGATASSIGSVLAERDVIRSALVFRLKARNDGLDANLQAGTYVMETGMSVDEAIARLRAGPRSVSGVRFTVQEGLDVEQTLARLAQQTPFSVEDYREVLDRGDLTLPDWVPPLDSFGPDVREPYEGLLFPETYEVREDASAQQILQRMVDQLVHVTEAIPPQQVEAAAAAELDRYEVLILASLIERETRVDDERPRVSGVLRNRLATRGYRLQVDATVLYALGEHKDRVLEEDLDVDSPYNTYRVDGLPPTPIAGAGRASIEAAYAPEDNRFLYYVLDDCDAGTHAFSETLDEHNRNVSAFRELPCAQGG